MPIAFRERPAKSIVYVATIRTNSAPPPNNVAPGDDVKLYVDSIEVFVKVTQALPDGYRGKILGANSRGTPNPELKAGNEVAFLDKHIFTCSKRQA